MSGATGGIVLAIDTAVAVAAGVAIDGVAAAATTLAGGRNHVEQLTPVVQGVVAAAGVSLRDVTAVVVGMGPGPFTGLRVGIVSAQVLANTLGVPLHHVCTLDALAAQWVDAPAEFVVVTDARRKEVYWARYRDGARVEGPVVTPPGEVPALPAAGPGVELCAHLTPAGEALAVDAGVLAVRGLGLPDVGPAPLYLRRPDATVSTRTKSVLVATRRRSR